MTVSNPVSPPRDVRLGFVDSTKQATVRWAANPEPDIVSYVVAWPGGEMRIQSVPRDLFEAARIDGDSYWSMFRRIALPLAKPALIVVFIFELQAQWFDLLKPLKRPGHPRDIARAALFFCSDLAEWVTGQSLTVGDPTTPSPLDSLIGVPVGSRVLVSIPPDLGYGEGDLPDGAGATDIDRAAVRRHGDDLTLIGDGRHRGGLGARLRRQGAAAAQRHPRCRLRAGSGDQAAHVQPHPRTRR